MDTVQMPFGLRNGKLIHISAASRGLDCGCVCAGCSAPLIARKGTVKQHHFAHAADSDCATGYETALHLAAKEIIDRRKEIVLPPVLVYSQSDPRWTRVRHPRSFMGDQSYSDHDSIFAHPALVIAKEQTYHIQEVRMETRLGRIIPDVTAYIDATPLIVEIKVTHAVDATKLRQIKKLQISAIEIDLSSIPRDIDIPLLESLVIGAGKHKKWLYNRKARRKTAELQRNVYRAFREARRQERAHERECVRLRMTASSQSRSLPMVVDAKSNQYVTVGCPVSFRLYRVYQTPFQACAIHVTDTETSLPVFTSTAQEMVLAGCVTHWQCESCPYNVGHDDSLVHCIGMSDYAIAKIRAGTWHDYDGTRADISLLPIPKIMRILRYLHKRGHTKDNSAWVQALSVELASRKQQGYLHQQPQLLQSI